jgi:thiol-disulfide isomerase/thioredoxin
MQASGRHQKGELRGTSAGPGARGTEHRGCTVVRWETSLEEPTDSSAVYRTRTLFNRAMRRPLIIAAAVAIVAAVAIGVVQTSGNQPGPAGVTPSPAAARAALEGSPTPLAEVHDAANALLPIDGFEQRIKALRGYPIVVNVWGSWCNPCREEFPVFERVSVALGKRVAFLGLATQDSKEEAGKFLEAHPVTYPSYMDFDGKVADSFGIINAPSTVFYDRRGRRAYLHQGKYANDADLKDDIRQYADA